MNEGRKAAINMIMRAVSEPINVGKLMEKLIPAIKDGHKMNYERSGVSKWGEPKLIAFLTEDDGKARDVHLWNAAVQEAEIRKLPIKIDEYKFDFF